MKKILILALGALAMISCAKKPCCNLEHPCYSYDATIYELNTRQLTPEGTFKAAEAVLPALKEIGVDIIWIMPIQKIGELERKGTLGSYYAITDYCQFNPEFGTRADFEHFLAEAHKLGLKVILDWVANHTAPDSEWTKNEGWHYRDSLGNLMVQYDWTDISKLNYDNHDMRAEMKKAMHWWMDTIGIDGFRCDVAGEVPTDFWNDAMAELRAKHPNMFTLAEDEAEAQDLTETAFDMYYGWELHHLMNGVAQGSKTVEDLWGYFAKVDTTIRKEAIRMNFTSNHDENSWTGTEFERMGDAHKTFAALTFVLPKSQPLIYTGQEIALQRRLEFFEKDSVKELVDLEYGKEYRDFYKSLTKFRHENKALAAGQNVAPMVFVEGAPENVLAFTREKEGNKVFCIFNFSAEPTTLTITEAEAGDYACICGETKSFKAGDVVELAAWGFMLLSK